MRFCKTKLEFKHVFWVAGSFNCKFVNTLFALRFALAESVNKIDLCRTCTQAVAVLHAEGLTSIERPHLHAEGFFFGGQSFPIFVIIIDN